MDTSVLDKIRALLAKAESTDSTHEAEALTDRANQMMIKYAVDQAMLDAMLEKPDVIITDHVVTVLGPYVKIRVSLLNVISRALGVKAIRMISPKPMTASPVHLIGYSKDIEMVEMLYTSLLLQSSAELLREEKKYSHIHGKTFRTSFMYGYVVRVDERLEEIYKEVVDSTPGTGLVLVRREAKVASAVKELHPRLVKTSGGRARSHAGFYGGQDAANRADLGQKRVSNRQAIH